MYGTEIGNVTYNSLKVNLRLVDVKFAENFKEREARRLNPKGYANRAFFTSETYKCAIEFSHSIFSNFDMGDDMIEIEPGVVVSRNWAKIRGYDVNKPAFDKNAVFSSLIAEVAKHCKQI